MEAGLGFGEMDAGFGLGFRFAFCFLSDDIFSKLRLPSRASLRPSFLILLLSLPQVRILSIAYLCMAPPATSPRSLLRPPRPQCPPLHSRSRSNSSPHGTTGGPQSPRLLSPRLSPQYRTDAFLFPHSTIHQLCCLPSPTLTGASRAIHQVCLPTLTRAHVLTLTRQTKSLRHRPMNGTQSMTRIRTVYLPSCLLFPLALSTLPLRPLSMSSQKTPSRPTRMCSTGLAVTPTALPASSQRRRAR